MQKVFTSPNMCQHYTGKFEMTDWAVNELLPCTFNESLNSHNTTGSCFKNHQTCIKFSHLYTLEMSASRAYQDHRCRRTETTHHERLNSLNHADHSTWHQRLYASVRADGRHFDHNAKMMRLTTRLTIFETITASRFVAIQWFIKMYM